MSKSLRTFSATILVLALAAAMLITNCNTSILRSDEAIHSRVVQEMAFEEGSAFSPTFFNRLYLNKPPLQFWLSAPLVRVLGDENRNYRIIPILAGFGSCVVLILFSFVLFHSVFPGLLSILIAFGGPQVLLDHGMRIGTMDSLLLFLTLAAMLTLWLALTTERKRWILSTGVLVGLGCLTKWVAGLVPWLAFAALLLVDHETRRSFKRHFLVWAFAGAISVAPAGIFIVYHLAYDYDATVGALQMNIAERLVGHGFHNQDDFWLYFTSIGKGHYGNVFLLVLGALYTIATLTMRRSKFLAVWGFFPLLLYSTLHSRLPWYYLPAVPALWLMTGAAFIALIRRPTFLRIPLILIGACLLGFSLMRNVHRIMNLDRIPLDTAVEKIRANKPYTISFRDVSPKVEGSLKMSRRYLNYLNRLSLDAASVTYDPLSEKIGSTLTVVPYASLESVPFPEFKSFLCPESDFSQPYDRVCILSQRSEGGFNEIGSLVTPGTDPTSRLSGITDVEKNGRQFGEISGRIANLGIALDQLSSRYLQKLSINAAATAPVAELFFNGYSLGPLALNSKLQTIEVPLPQEMVTEGTNVLTFRNPDQSVITINWVSLRPIKGL